MVLKDLLPSNPGISVEIKSRTYEYFNNLK